MGRTYYYKVLGKNKALSAPLPNAVMSAVADTHALVLKQGRTYYYKVLGKNKAHLAPLPNVVMSAIANTNTLALKWVGHTTTKS